MNLNKKALDLSYKLLANVGVKDYSNHVPDVQRTLLASFVEVYVKARSDECRGIDFDPATQITFHDID